MDRLFKTLEPQELQKFVWVLQRVKENTDMTDLNSVIGIIEQGLKDYHYSKQTELKVKHGGVNRKKFASAKKISETIVAPKACPKCEATVWVNPNNKKVEPAVKIVNSMPNDYDFELLCRVCRWSKYIGRGGK